MFLSLWLFVEFVFLGKKPFIRQWPKGNCNSNHSKGTFVHELQPKQYSNTHIVPTGSSSWVREENGTKKTAEHTRQIHHKDKIYDKICDWSFRYVYWKLHITYCFSLSPAKSLTLLLFGWRRILLDVLLGESWAWAAQHLLNVSDEASQKDRGDHQNVCLHTKCYQRRWGGGRNKTDKK